VEKIEVVHGAESAVYGSDAMTGVIQIFTHRGDTREPELDLTGEGGSFDTGRGSATLSGLLGLWITPSRMAISLLPARDLTTHF